jgi:hypothetical protein
MSDFEAILIFAWAIVSLVAFYTMRTIYNEDRYEADMAKATSDPQRLRILAYHLYVIDPRMWVQYIAFATLIALALTT